MPDFTDVPPARSAPTLAEVMSRHGNGGRCPLCDLIRCPAYRAAHTEHVAEPARTFDAAVRQAYGPPQLGDAGSVVGQIPLGQQAQAFYEILDGGRG